MTILIGTVESDELRGNSGDNDILDTLGGRDSLYGFAGDDYLKSSNTSSSARKSNLLDGGSGEDILVIFKGARNNVSGGSGADFIKSKRSRNSTLRGGSGDDTIRSRFEINTQINGGNGNDFLYSYDGENNQLRGGLGNDRIKTVGGTNLIFSGFGQDTIESGGTDVLVGEYRRSPAPIIIQVEDPDVGSGAILGEGVVNTSFSTVESFQLFGGQFDDVFVTGNGNDTLEGGSGDDVLNAQAGNNIIRGEDGNDTILSFEKGSLSGGMGNDTVFAQAGDFEINGNEGDDDMFVLESTGTVDGGDGYDIVRINYQNWPFGIEMTLETPTSATLVSQTRQVFFQNIEEIEVFGSLGDDSLVGSDGADLFNGNEGVDTITGGSGSDTFRFGNPNFALDIITDFDVSEDVFDIVTVGSPVIPRFPDFGSGAFENLTVTELGSLDPAEFNVGANATSSSHRIVYNDLTGELFYDSDGVGGGEQVQFAQLSSNLDLSPDNFIVR